MNTSILLDMGAYGLDVVFTSLIRYFAITGAAFAVFWVLLRERLTHRKIQSRTPKRNKILFDIRHSVTGILAIATTTATASVLEPLGFMQLYDGAGDRGWGYFAFSIVFLAVGHDTYIYWTHRLIHRKSLFRRVHAVHHRSSNPNPFTAYSVSWLEGMLHGAYLPLMAVCLPLNLWAVGLFLMYMMVMDAYLHLGYELLPQWFARHPLTGWLATSTYHNLHHHRSRCNYSAYFTWWDRAMGTIHPDYVAIYEKVTAKPLVQAPISSGLTPDASFHGVG